jgi:hypothetical protein
MSVTVTNLYSADYSLTGYENTGLVDFVNDGSFYYILISVSGTSGDGYLLQKYSVGSSSINPVQIRSTFLSISGGEHDVTDITKRPCIRLSGDYLYLSFIANFETNVNKVVVQKYNKALELQTGVTLANTSAYTGTTAAGTGFNDTGNDYNGTLDLDSTGNIYLCLSTDIALSSYSLIGSRDVYLIKLNSSFAVQTIADPAEINSTGSNEMPYIITNQNFGSSLRLFVSLINVGITNPKGAPGNYNSGTYVTLCQTDLTTYQFANPGLFNDTTSTTPLNQRPALAYLSGNDYIYLTFQTEGTAPTGTKVGGSGFNPVVVYGFFDSSLYTRTWIQQNSDFIVGAMNDSPLQIQSDITGNFFGGYSTDATNGTWYTSLTGTRDIINYSLDRTDGSYRWRLGSTALNQASTSNRYPVILLSPYDTSTGSYTSYTVSAASLHLSGNANAGSCINEGTLIMTPKGEKLVEDLQEGDLVLTSDGRKVPILLKRSMLGYYPSRVIPKNYFKEGIPSRDVIISQDHSCRYEGIIRPAFALSNIETIICTRMYHLALPSFENDFMIASGLEIEGYDELEKGNFEQFISPEGIITRVFHEPTAQL